MKTKFFTMVAALLASAGLMSAATNDLTSLIQKGLFEEEANHDLTAAARDYQAAVDGFDQNRQLQATAVFRLGECWRKLGKTNEANVQYQRVLREFPDQTNLTKLCAEYLGGITSGLSPLEIYNLNLFGGGSAKPVAAADAEDEEVRKIKDMIRNSPDLVNGDTSSGAATPLQLEAFNGNVAAAELLLANGADPDKTTSLDGYTPLCAAAVAGDKAIVELLLDKGAKVNAPSQGNHNAQTPLHIAAAKGFKGLVELLLVHNADVTARDSFGDTPLSYAAKNGNRDVVEQLIAHQANFDARDNNGRTPLFQAAMQNKPEIVELLLTNKADANLAGNQGETPLLIAAYNNQPAIVNMLLADKADPNATLKSGITPLLVAVSRNDIDISLVKSLLENGANPQAQVAGSWDYNLFDNLPTSYMFSGCYPVDVAIRSGRADMLELLLASHADPNATSPWNQRAVGSFPHSITPLILAAEDYDTQQAKILLDHGANPDLADDLGMTPLMHAVHAGNPQMVQELLDYHADVNKTDMDGVPALAFLPDETPRPGGQPQRLRPALPSGGGFKGTTAPPPDFTAVRAMLLKAGANDDYLRLNRIFITQTGTGSIGKAVFKKDANSVNHYTLLELIAEAYQRNDSGGVPFPDLAHVVINRLETNSAKSEIPVNVDEILTSGDCSKDVPLEWGDVVQIPQRDHAIDAMWRGFRPFGPVAEPLRKCLHRQVEIVVKEQAAPFTLEPRVSRVTLEGLSEGVVPDKTLYTFSLDEVVHGANVLLLSSDLTRVKVTRNGTAMVYNLEANSHPDLWLRDGDVIEILERDPNAPAAK